MHNSNENKSARLTGLGRKTKVAAVAMALAAMAALGILTASAEKPKNKPAHSTFNTTDPVYGDFAFDRNGDVATEGDTPLFTNSALECDHLVPVIAPDGHHITLAEWRQPTGEAHAVCRANGTLVHVKLTGLIPNGVYTIWLATFDPPGATLDLSNMVGVGSLGLPDGSQNHFVASAKGEHVLTVFQPAGPLSIFGEVTDCLLEESEVVLWVALHMDGQTHGPVPHPADQGCTLAFPGGFSFKK